MNWKNDKLWCGIAGAAVAIVGGKILKAPKTRELAVSGIAKGMKLHADAKSTFQSMKDDAADLCYDAKLKADADCCGTDAE